MSMIVGCKVAGFVGPLRPRQQPQDLFQKMSTEAPVGTERMSCVYSAWKGYVIHTYIYVYTYRCTICVYVHITICVHTHSIYIYVHTHRKSSCLGNTYMRRPVLFEGFLLQLAARSRASLPEREMISASILPSARFRRHPNYVKFVDILHAL